MAARLISCGEDELFGGRTSQIHCDEGFGGFIADAGIGMTQIFDDGVDGLGSGGDGDIACEGQKSLLRARERGDLTGMMLLDVVGVIFEDSVNGGGGDVAAFGGEAGDDFGGGEIEEEVVGDDAVLEGGSVGFGHARHICSWREISRGGVGGEGFCCKGAEKFTCRCVSRA